MKNKWLQYAGKPFTIWFAVTGLTGIISFAFLCPGSLLLKWIGLQWRNQVTMTLLIVITVSLSLFTAGVVLMLIVRTKGRLLFRMLMWVLALALTAMLFFFIWFGMFYIIMSDCPEAVVDWNGQKCVTSDIVWHHINRIWYAYHGPFVMGHECLHSECIR